MNNLIAWKCQKIIHDFKSKFQIKIKFVIKNELEYFIYILKYSNDNTSMVTEIHLIFYHLKINIFDQILLLSFLDP